MSRLLGIPGAKIDVVPLGITVDEYEPRARPVGRGFTIGHFGRLAPEKGLHLLCEAYHRLREAGKLDGGSIKIAGDVSPTHAKYLDSIMNQAARWGLEADVTYHGKLDLRQKVDFLNTLDVLAVPAVYDDPKGLPLLEAMACGVPTIVPRRGTYAELVERTGGGVTVAPDDIPALEAALERLATDAAYRQQLGQRGAAGVREHYSAEVMATRAADVYERVARGRASTAPQGFSVARASR